jgi:hypothetical protein
MVIEDLKAVFSIKAKISKNKLQNKDKVNNNK